MAQVRHEALTKQLNQLAAAETAFSRSKVIVADAPPADAAADVTDADESSELVVEGTALPVPATLPPPPLAPIVDITDVNPSASEPTVERVYSPAVYP